MFINTKSRVGYVHVQATKEDRNWVLYMFTFCAFSLEVQKHRV
jgi:hypothetical protein